MLTRIQGLWQRLRLDHNCRSTFSVVSHVYSLHNGANLTPCCLCQPTANEIAFYIYSSSRIELLPAKLRSYFFSNNLSTHPPGGNPFSH
jgi:hypothetical protein